MSVVFWLNLVWAPVAAYALQRGNLDVVSPCGTLIALTSIGSETSAFIVKLVIRLAGRHMLLHDINREVRAAKSIEEAFGTLLKGMCDAVVHLDTYLHLKRRWCPQVDVLLLRNSGANCHPNFVDLLNTDDRARFRGSTQHRDG